MDTDPGVDIGGNAALRHAGRVIVVVDVVESVRLMHAAEQDVIDRWRRFVHEARATILPAHAVQLVKSQGDGLRMEFASVNDALAATKKLHQSISTYNANRSASLQLWLRASIHRCDLVVDDIDLHGDGVNLAARLATLAGPGETIVSAEIRDQFIAGIDPPTEDLGYCYLKHYDEPVRAYRLGVRQDKPEKPDGDSHKENLMRAGIAVLPLRPRFVLDSERAAGDLIADQVVAALSRTPYLRVISRLSTSTLAARAFALKDVGTALGAQYVVSGTFDSRNGRIYAYIELADATTSTALWSDRLDAELGDLLAGQDGLIPQLVSLISSSVISHELKRSSQIPLPTLQSHSLLMSGIACLHRSSVTDFDRARVLLESLADRHARAPHGNAWLGKWYVFRQVQGFSTDIEGDAHRALDRSNRALDCDPHSALALAMSGHVHGFLLKDLDTAGHQLDLALAINPNESLAWLYRAVLRAWQGRGDEAMLDANMALSLSPVDPMRYYYETITAFAALTAGRFELARDLGLSSLRANCVHGSTFRTLAIAHWQLGQTDEARRVVERMMALDRGFTVSRYRARFPGGDTVHARQFADVLHACGAPP